MRAQAHGVDAAAASEPLVYVIIPSFNGKRNLEICLPSVLKTRFGNYRIVVVDNGSADGTADFVRRRFPDVLVSVQRKNLGFAGANNKAIAEAIAHGAQYLTLLNDDTEIIDSMWLAAAITVAESDQTIGMVGFREVHSRGSRDFDGVVTASARCLLPGFALVVRAAVFEDVGLFDEVYFIYSEEDDLEFRAIAAGYRLVSISVPIYHEGSGTSKRFPVRVGYYQMRNYIRYGLKHHGFARAALRAVRIVDIACNPIPLSMDPTNPAHRRIRADGKLLRNSVIFLFAMLWNVVFLPQTLLIRARDRRRIAYSLRRRMEK